VTIFTRYNPFGNLRSKKTVEQQVIHRGKEVTWSSDNEAEVLTARETFQRMTREGYQAFRPGASKGQRGNRITEFDPAIEKMVLFPQLQGG
jgi:hypothetical protein